MTNEDCIEKAPEILKDVVHPSDMYASGEEVDPSTNLESDGCAVISYLIAYINKKFSRISFLKGDSGSPL